VILSHIWNGISHSAGAHLLHSSFKASSAQISSSTVVTGLHLAGERDSTPEAAAAEQAVKRARQGGAEGASGAVFEALEAAEAQHNRQQQGKRVCACPSCHTHPPVRSCILKKIDSYQHIAVLDVLLFFKFIYVSTCICVSPPFFPFMYVVFHHSQAGMDASR